jgi:[acyl-carrier-protein] S-malonyltransferase
VTRVALCFPGQGSQVAGMADGLLDTPGAAALLAAAADEGVDLAGALGGDDDALRPTQIAQPALLFVELTLASLLPETLDIVGVAGHSVGEYAAASVAGVHAPADAMRLVVARGREMASMTDGTMAAVLGLAVEEVERTCSDITADGETVVVANLNAPGQVVISGTRDGVERAGDALRTAGARRVVPLNVSGAFHSPLMHDAATRFATVLDRTPRGRLRTPLVTNVDGAVVRDAEDVPDRMRRQLESPVRWVDCVAALAGLGAELLIEVGPGTVLSGLTRRIDPALRTTAVATPGAARRVAEAAGVAS